MPSLSGMLVEGISATEGSVAHLARSYSWMSLPFVCLQKSASSKQLVTVFAGDHCEQVLSLWNEDELNCLDVSPA